MEAAFAGLLSDLRASHKGTRVVPAEPPPRTALLWAQLNLARVEEAVAGSRR
jgi:hypothetical protein